MSTIVLSSEDEDELLILDADDQVNVQPPHMVFILENKTNDNLLREDDSESNEDQILGESCYLEFEEPENIFPEAIASPFPKEFFENERPVESLNWTTQPNKKYQSCSDEDTCELKDFEHNYMNSNVESPDKEIAKQDNWTTQSNKNYQSCSDEDTCELKDFEHNYMNSNLESPAKEIAKQDNNAIFQRLAEALSTALSSPLDINAEVCVNNKRDDIDLRSEENINLDADNAANSKFAKTNELLNKTITKSESCQISVNNAAVIVKKRGRKPGWKKTPVPNPSKTQISGQNSTPNKKKRGRKPGWRKPLEPNPCAQKVSEENTSTSFKKCGRKPLEPNPCAQKVSEENTSTSLKKRGRKLGWRKYPKSDPKGIAQGHANQITISDRSKDEVDPNKVIKSNDISDKNKSKRKPVQQKKIDPASRAVNDHDVFTSGMGIKTKDIHCSSKNNVNQVIPRGSSNKNKSKRKPVPQKKIDPASRAVNDHDVFTPGMGSKTKDIYCSSKNNVNQVIPRGSSDLLNPSSDSTLQDFTPYYDGPNTPDGLLKVNNTFIEDFNESCVNKLPEPNLSIHVQPKLTGNVDQDAVILKEDFIRCYNKIFDTNAERLSSKLGDMLLLAMKEVKNCKERMKYAKKLTCELLRNKEMYITEDSFKNTLNKYRTSFCDVFHEILLHILSNEEVVYQQKALLLAVFIKIFVRVSTLSPEYLDSLILAKNSMTSLLNHYLLSAPESIYVILRETFWQSDTDFERNCWFILDFCLTSLSEQNDYSNNMLQKIDKTTTLKTVNQYLNNKFQPQTGTSRNSAEVSVIVRNQYHKEERCSSTVNTNNYSSIHPVRQTINHVNSASSTTYSKQFSSTNINSESVQYVANNMNSDPEESIGKENGNNYNSKNQSYLSRTPEIHDTTFLQTNQHATLNSLQQNAQTIDKENTSKDFVGVKRKTFDLDNCPIKIAKTTENQLPVNTTTYSQQNILTNAGTTDAVGLLQGFAPNSLRNNGFNADNLHRSFHISNSNSEVRRGFPPSYYGCERSDFTLMPNSDTNVSCKVKTGDRDTHCYSAPLSHINPKNNLQFQHGPMNLSTNRAYMDSCKPIENKSLPTERYSYNHQITRYTPHSERQQYLSFHQAQSYSAAYGQKFSYHNQTSPQYNQYSTSSVNYQSQKQPTSRQNQAVLQYNQHPNSYTPTYGYSPYRPDPRLDIGSVKSATEKPVVSGTHTVTQEFCPSPLPQQIQRIRSNSGITINNYNINTYVPPTMPEHPSQRVNSDPYFPHNTTNTFDMYDALIRKHLLAPKSVSEGTLHHKATK